MTEQGKVKCKECGEKYYDPEKFDCCYDCHKLKPAEIGADYPFDLPREPS